MIGAMRRVGAQADRVAPDLAYLSPHLLGRAAIAAQPEDEPVDRS